MSEEKTLTALAVNFDTQWYYAIPKKQNLGSDDWEKCNCTWMKPEPGVLSSFRHPMHPETPMRWFRHDVSTPSPVFRYARFGFVTFVGTLDPNNDPMTSRWIWGVSEDDHNNMESIYAGIVASEAEEARKVEEQRRAAARATQTAAAICHNLVDSMPPALEGRCIHVGNGEVYFCPCGSTTTFEENGSLRVSSVLKASSITSDALEGSYYIADPTKSSSLECAPHSFEVIDVSWTGPWSSDENVFQVIRLKIPAGTNLVKRLRNDGDDDRSIAEIASSRQRIQLRQHQVDNRRSSQQRARHRAEPQNPSRTTTLAPVGPQTSTIEAAPFSLEDILKCAGEEIARVAAVRP